MHPDISSVIRDPKKRKNRVYLDFLQNRSAQTLAAPYSASLWPGGTVSTPLQWNEVRRGLDPAKFTLFTVPARVRRVGDLWKPVLGKGVDLSGALGKLQRKMAA